jgi:ABC-type antimicrobial peptide transport system permease subunit
MIPLSYTLRSLWSHKLTTLLTVLGITLVVFVFAAVLMLAGGLRQTLVATGSDDNVIAIREASQTEVQSIIGRDQADIVSTFPQIATASDGLPLFTGEIYVLITLAKRASGERDNVVVRGVNDKSMELRPKVTLAEGRMWREGTSEIIAGKSAAATFSGCGPGETVRFGARDWTVVGVFDAQGTAFDSELWGDIDQMMDAFRRPVYSSLTFRLNDPDDFEAVVGKVESDRRLPLEVYREKQYYDNQSKFMSGFIVWLGGSASVLFGLAAIVGAAITMYAAVARRTREIGTLRALGFSRGSILRAYLLEAVIISLAGAILGLVAASFLGFARISMTNWSSFSSLAFNFHLSGWTIISSLIFALIMGLIGGFFPAVRAARKKIVDALRAV